MRAIAGRNIEHSAKWRELDRKFERVGGRKGEARAAHVPLALRAALDDGVAVRLDRVVPVRRHEELRARARPPAQAHIHTASVGWGVEADCQSGKISGEAQKRCQDVPSDRRACRTRSTARDRKRDRPITAGHEASVLAAPGWDLVGGDCLFTQWLYPSASDEGGGSAGAGVNPPFHLHLRGKARVHGARWILLSVKCGRSPPPNS